MNADVAKGQSELAAIASGKAAESEAQAKHAAGEAAAAKDRLNKLAKGEDVAGGVGNPRTREDFERILMDAGWSPDDIRFSVALAGLRGDEEFEAFLTTKLRTSRAHGKINPLESAAQDRGQALIHRRR
jgi:hypothetical protein